MSDTFRGNVIWCGCDFEVLKTGADYTSGVEFDFFGGVRNSGAKMIGVLVLFILIDMIFIEIKILIGIAIINMAFSSFLVGVMFGSSEPRIIPNI